MSQVSRIALRRSSQNVFVFVFVFVIVFVFIYVFVNFFGHVMSSYHSEQMSQRSQVSRIAPWRFSLNVFVFVFVFVFVIDFFLTGHVFSSLWSNITKGRTMSPIELCMCMHCSIFSSKLRGVDPEEGQLSIIFLLIKAKNTNRWKCSPETFKSLDFHLDN